MAAHQASPSLGFSRQEHWSGLPFPSPMHESEKWKWSRSVVSDSPQPHGLQPTRLLHQKKHKALKIYGPYIYALIQDKFNLNCKINTWKHNRILNGSIITTSIFELLAPKLILLLCLVPQTLVLSAFLPQDLPLVYSKFISWSLLAPVKIAKEVKLV